MWTNAGGDFAPAPSLTVTTTPLGIATSAPSTAIANDVQSWLDDPATNHGWLLKSTEALPFVTRRLDSRETTTGVAPSLAVSYIMPGQTGSYGIGCLVATQTYTHALTGPFVGGSTVSLVQSNGPAGQLAANLIALELNRDGFPLLPGCRLLLPLSSATLSHSIVTLDANGGKVTPFALPSGFPGIAIFSQSAALDPTSAPGFVLSNAAIGLLQ